MKKIINSVFLFILSLVSIVGTNINLSANEIMSAIDTVTVSTEADLVSELSDLETISGTTKTIVIDTDISLTDAVNVNMAKGKDVIITSQNNATLTSVANKKHFTLTSGANALTISNLQLVGNIEATHISGDTLLDTVSAATDGGGIYGTTTGKVTIDNVNFKYIKEKAVYINSSGDVYIKNSNFTANSAETEGSAVRAQGTGNFYIENTIFENNYARKDWQINYIGATVFAGNTSVNLNINNTAFINNKSLQAGTNESATGGGAVAFKQVNGSLTVNNSYFYGNEVDSLIGKDIGNGTNSDGGAIYSWHSTGKITIQNSTFEKNIASDEGGAISLVCSSNPDNLISNNTFVENRSRGQQVSITWGIGNDGNDGGGAVELNGNDTVRSYAKVINNTFYNNTAEKGNAILDGNRGGGISFRKADALVQNNIIVGNTGTSTAAYHNINVEAGSNVTLENNVIDELVANVFGTETPVLEVNNNVNKAAGYDIKTLKIAPNNGSTATGLADGVAVGATATDQRGFTRTAAADAGSVDMLYIEYNANGGSWLGNVNETSYEDNWYYKSDTTGTITEKFNMVNYNETTHVIISGNPTRTGHIFVGWNTDPNATTALPTDQLEAYLKNVKENKLLYAVWEEGKGTLIIVVADEFDNTTFLPGAEFRLEDANGVTVKTGITTSITGRVIVPNLAAGEYKLIQTKAPTGYMLDTTVRPINIVATSTTTIRLFNEPTTTFSTTMDSMTSNLGSIRIIATDAEDDTKVLGNVAYDITDQDGDVVSTVTTNNAGVALVSGIEAGTYTILSKNDEKVMSTVNVNANNETTTRIKNEVIEKYKTTNSTGSFSALTNVENDFTTVATTDYQVFATGYFMFAKYYINNLGQSKALAGAKFEIINTDTNVVFGEYTSNALGEIVIAALPEGNYKIVETFVPTGFEMIPSEKEKPFVMDPSGAIVVEMENAESTGTTPTEIGTGVLIKRDRHTQEAMPGVEYQLLDSAQTVIRTGLVTDVDGKIVLDDLEPGLYYWQETQAPFGYVLDTSLLDFIVTDGGYTQYITENTLIRANITFLKEDGDTSAVLANAQFKVSGTIFGTYREYTITTGADGKATIANLLPGTYTVEELVAPTGYELLTGTLNLVVVKGGTSENSIFVIQNFTTPAPKYQVTYDGNGNTGGIVPVDSTQYVAGATVTVATGEPTKTDNIFAGWTDGTNTYDAGDTFTMPAGNVTLKAVWTPVPKYQVTYDGNGNTGGIVPVDGTQYAAGATVTVATGTPTKADNIFGGWTDGTNTYDAGDTFTMPAGNVTLTAVWTPTSKYQVIYNGNGNTGGIVPVDVTLYEAGDTATVLSDQPTKTDNIFAGWTDGTNTYDAGDTFTMPAGNVTLTAVWTPVPKYQVTYDGNGNTGGVVPTDNTQYVAGATVTVATGEPTKTDNIFAGWTDGTNTYDAGDTFTMPSGNVTLTAIWTPSTKYQVTYDGNGHTGGIVPVDVTLYESGDVATVLSDEPIKDSHIFSGWTDGTNTYAAGDTFTMTDCHITLIAIWTPVVAPVTYSVTYNGNGNTGGVVPVDAVLYEAGDIVTILAGEPTKVDNIFSGWTDGTNTYYAGDTFVMPASDVTLTAVWTPVTIPITYTVTYDGNGNTGGVVPVEATLYEAGDIVTVLTGTPTKAGYTFIGWSDGTNGYMANDTFTMPAGNVTLTAVWTPILETTDNNEDNTLVETGENSNETMLFGLLTMIFGGLTLAILTKRKKMNR